MGNPQYLKHVEQVVTGRNAVYARYPVYNAGVSVGFVTATAGAAFTYGVDAELVAAAGIVAPFWVCTCFVSAVSVAETYLIDVEQAGTTEVFNFVFGATAVTPNFLGYSPPYPVAIAGSVQITARIATVSGADTANLSVLVATGL